MTRSEDAQLTICAATDESAEDALRLVFSGLPSALSEEYAHFVLAEIRAGRIPTEGLLEGRRDGRLVGAMWLEVQPGRAALIWPPRMVSGEPRSSAEQLLSIGCELAAQRGVCIAQALLSTVNMEEDTSLRAAGFERLAALLYLGWESSGTPEDTSADTLEYETYDCADRPRLARLLEATYEGTLDCPALDGLRTMDEILDGYQSVGVFSPERWYYVRQEGRDMGCLLLADHPRESNVELAYMGLIPEARGFGWGRQICRKAKSSTRESGRARLVVAVDAANWPAIEMYASTGFRVWDRRTVYVRQIAQPDRAAKRRFP
jgi:mycothiol synthase